MADTAAGAEGPINAEMRAFLADLADANPLDSDARDDAGDTDDAGGLDTKAADEDVPETNGDDDATDGDDSDGEPEVETKAKAADPDRGDDKLIIAMRKQERELTALRKELKDLKARPATDTSTADFLEEYELDRTGAIKKLLTSKFGDKTLDELRELQRDLVYDVAGIDENPDLDKDEALARKLRRQEAETKRSLREMQRKLDEKDREVAAANATHAERQAVQNLDGWLKAETGKGFRFLNAQPEAAQIVLRELRAQQQNGLRVDDSNVDEVLGQISKAVDTYYQQEAQRYRDLLRGGDESGSNEKRAGVTRSKKPTLTNRGASGAPQVKKRAEAKGPEEQDDFFKRYGI